MKFRLIKPNKSNPLFRLQRSADGGATWSKSNHEQVDTLNVLLAKDSLSESDLNNRAQEILAYLRKDDPQPSVIIVSPGNQKIVDVFLKATYPDKVRIKRISDDALRTLKYDMQHMLRTLEETPIESDQVRLQNFIDSNLRDNPNRHIKTVTCLNRIRATLGLPGLRYLTLDKEDIVYLSQDETDDLIIRASEPYKTLIGVAFYVGLRKGEIFALEPQYVFEGYVKIEWQIKPNGKKTLPKWRKKRKAFIIPGGERYIQRWLDIKGMFPTRLYDELRTDPFIGPPKMQPVNRGIKVSTVTQELAGIRFHDNRHSYAVHLITKGASLDWVAQSMGITIKVAEKHYASHVLQDDSITLLNNLLRKTGK